MPEGFEQARHDRSDENEDGASEEMLDVERLVDPSADPEQILIAQQEREKNGEVE
jgi:hypothetical protein